MDFPDLELNLTGVCDLIETLRGPKGCPWDIEQTPNSLTKHLVEECYELVEAIENNDLDNIEEEIGDLLLNLSYQIVFLKEKHYSNEENLIKKLFSKIHTRHPHVFSDLELSDSASVEKNWQKIKNKSNKNNIDRMPKYLPSLILAQKIQKKYSNLNKMSSEIDSLSNMKNIINEQKSLSSDMVGKILFEVSNYARLNKIDSEKSLKKYINNYMDQTNER
tara:strand:- start:559 stop:1218 length:660 start_codon:yes stop_codon:yes gene_type:complete